MPLIPHTITVSDKSVSFSLCPTGEDLNASVDVNISIQRDGFRNRHGIMDALQAYFYHRQHCRDCTPYCQG